MVGLRLGRHIEEHDTDALTTAGLGGDGGWTSGRAQEDPRRHEKRPSAEAPRPRGTFLAPGRLGSPPGPPACGAIASAPAPLALDRQREIDGFSPCPHIDMVSSAGGSASFTPPGGAKRRRWWRGFLFGALGVAVVGSLTGVGVGVYAYRKYASDLPRRLDVVTDYRPLRATEIFSADGELIGRFFIENRVLVPVESLPNVLKQAFVAAEDNRFYQHGGIDYLGILRAAWANARAGHVVQGGSTITQQVAKLLLVGKERSLARKVREAVLAHRIEKQLGKDQILGIYLNHVYLGHGAYGVAAAAQTYFGKDVRALTAAEAAMLAGLPKAPGRATPFHDVEKARGRQRYVLEQMRSLGFLSEAEHAAALAEPLGLVSRARALSDVAAPYFVETIRRYLADNYGDEELLQRGLRVSTTLNMRRQRAAEAAVRGGLEDLARRLGFKGPLDHWEPAERARRARLGLEPFGPMGGTSDAEETRAGSAPAPAAWVIEENAGGGREPSPARAHTLAFDANAAWRAREAETRRALAQGKAPSGEGIDPASTYAAVVESLPPRLRLASGPWVFPLPSADESVLMRWRGPAGATLRVGDVVPIRFVQEAARLDGRGAGKPPAFTAVLAPPPPAGVEAALIALDPRNGHVEAMVGGYDYRTSQFNRAVQARRQIGSAMKPFIYATAIEHGLNQMTVKYDVPVKFQTASGVWAPHNYKPEYLGAVTLRTALAKSINTVSAQLVAQFGVDAVIKTIRRLGIVSALPRSLSLALGTADLGVAEVARALSPFVTGGRQVPMLSILQIVDADGRVLEDHRAPPTPTQVLDPEVAYVVGDLMKGVIEIGTGKRAQELGRPVLGKTGTSTNYRDAWFFGLTPTLVAGVWVGRDDFHPVAHDATGGQVSLPIWLAFMKEAVRDVPAQDISPPPGVLFVRADPLTGQPAPPGRPGTRLIPFRRGTLPVSFRRSAADVRFSDESF